MNRKKFDLGVILGRYGIYIAFVLLFSFLSIASPVFLTLQNIVNILRNVSVIGIMAVGMTYVIITGGIDLSVGAVVAFSGVIVASLVKVDSSHSMALVLLTGALVGLGCGAFSGFFVAKLDVPPFVVTLATMTIARGITYVYSNGRPVTGLMPDFIKIGGGSIGFLPIPVVIYIIVVICGVFFLNYTKFGRYVFAVGGNEKAAIVSGIRTGRVKLGVYLISGFCSSLAGMVLAARIQTGQPASGTGYELDAITAVVIGGASLSGGVGSVVGSVVGMLIIGIMTNGLDLLNVSSYYQQVIKGAIILIAVLSDRKKRALTA
jgi:ribose/xylose/arabinose/galactoside ABC-type transport system permease subunit